MIKPTTFEEALAMVPTHWMLTPGVDVWQKGDHYLSAAGEWRDAWDAYGVYGVSKIISVFESKSRRPIPQDVRERVAKLMLSIVESGIELQASSAYPLESWILAGKP